MDFMINEEKSGITVNKAVKMEENEIYDVIIIGGGPAALTAAVYCMRKGVKTGMILEELGGQVAWTKSVENYMGYRYIEGNELIEKFQEQVRQFEIGYIDGGIVEKVYNGGYKRVKMENGEEYKAIAVIIATGKIPNKLNVNGEKKFTGRGVTYCAVCDGPLYSRKNVAVVGGGNSAIEAAIDLAKVAKKVTVIQFLENFTADNILVEKLSEFDNVEIFFGHEVKEFMGNEFLEKIIVKERNGDNEKEISVQGVFIEIGLVPNSLIVKDLLQLNSHNEIVIDLACRTNVEGIFAAGDVTEVPFKQIIIAAGDGAKAALSACEYVTTYHKV